MPAKGSVPGWRVRIICLSASSRNRKQVAAKLRRRVALLGLEPERQLVEGQQLNVKQRQTPLPAQEDLQAPAQQIGGQKNQQRTEQVLSFVFRDFIDESVFKVGMKWAEDCPHDWVYFAPAQRLKSPFTMK
jgi:hypothetical protein